MPTGVGWAARPDRRRPRDASALLTGGSRAPACAVGPAARALLTGGSRAQACAGVPAAVRGSRPERAARHPRAVHRRPPPVGSSPGSRLVLVGCAVAADDDEVTADEGTDEGTGEGTDVAVATPAFDLPGALRRIRRLGDLSQRELASTAGLSVSAVAHAEAGSRDLPVGGLVRAAATAGLRLALVGGDGAEVAGMNGAAVRDHAGRRFPAHLDTRYGDEAWWHGPERYSRQQPWYTFDRVRSTRDFWRDRLGTADDHQVPRPGDAPEERAAARRRAARLQREEDAARRLSEAPRRPPAGDFSCECPPRCAELDDWSGRPVHAVECPCRCDVG